MDLTGYPVHEARIVHFCGLAKNHNILKHCAETFDEHQLALASLFTDLPLFINARYFYFLLSPIPSTKSM